MRPLSQSTKIFLTPPSVPVFNVFHIKYWSGAGDGWRERQREREGERECNLKCPFIL